MNKKEKEKGKIMKKEKTIFLPSRDNKNELRMDTVAYDEDNLIATVGGISIKLGAKTEILSYTPVLRADRKELISRGYSYNVTHSYSPSHKPIVRTVPSTYKYFYGEDKIIEYLLNPNFDTKIRDSFWTGKYYNGWEDIKRESYPFSNEFSFVNLYQYLSENNMLNDEKYLEVLKEYLKVFKITKTNKRITEEDFQKKYPYASRKRFVAERAYYVQTEIAKANSKILALRKGKE